MDNGPKQEDQAKVGDVPAAFVVAGVAGVGAGGAGVIDEKRFIDVN